jgi:2-keto-3-deoxy-L-rhamnonate aldolase RhmA
VLNLGKRVRGLLVKLASTEVVDIAAASGLDFCVVDLEHSQLAEHEAFRLVRHARALGFPALVRIAENDRGLVNRLLEAGADGIQLSTVRSATQVEDLRAACRYAPAGRRSISLNHPGARYGAVALADYVAEQGDGPLVVAQIETAETEDPLEDIVEARPDVLFVGVVDLTVDLGLDADRVRDRVDEIASAAGAAGIPLGSYALADERVRYDLVASDLGLVQKAVAALA